MYVLYVQCTHLSCVHAMHPYLSCADDVQKCQWHLFIDRGVRTNLVGIVESNDFFYINSQIKQKTIRYYLNWKYLTIQLLAEIFLTFQNFNPPPKTSLILSIEVAPWAKISYRRYQKKKPVNWDKFHFESFKIVTLWLSYLFHDDHDYC